MAKIGYIKVKTKSDGKITYIGNTFESKFPDVVDFLPENRPEKLDEVKAAFKAILAGDAYVSIHQSKPAGAAPAKAKARATKAVDLDDVEF
jgi:hypothetical protein